ncbi:MAG: hypothetical protein GY758_31645, partial [Fuerstiella sp.]|nr:hypothetical protein [Fuerstiella sp.]
MSADPDSFEESTFNSPRFQEGAAAFTSDYKRIGPDIYFNTLTQNSTNGMFVRVATPAGSETLKLTVPGRFDDSDIVHVVAQNLELRGTPGGSRLEETPPDVTITFAAAGGNGTLAPGSSFEYRVVFVNKNGFESPASDPTAPVAPSPGGGILLSQIPVAIGPYTGRHIYRSENGGPFKLVAELDRSATTLQD